MKNEKTSTWYQLILFCNSKGVGEVIKRRDILDHVFSNSKMTIDIYIKILRDANYLIWVKSGRYKLLKKIPELLKRDGKNSHKSEMEILFEKFDEGAENGS